MESDDRCIPLFKLALLQTIKAADKFNGRELDFDWISVNIPLRLLRRSDCTSILTEFTGMVGAKNNKICLEINGNEANDEIKAVGYYNTLNIPEADVNKADRIKLTLSLYQKSTANETTYNSVNLTEYLKDVKLFDKNGTPKAYTVNGNSLEFVLGKDELNYEAGTYEVLTAYSVKTGIEFENESKIYANYRVRLSAELIDGEGTSVSNSQCSDYIVYTNAKIYTKMITAE